MGKTLSAVKNALVPRGTRARTVRFGLLRGIRLNLDLQSGMQVYTGLAERELAPWWRKLSSGIKVAIDVGASEGTYTLYMLRKTKAERVVAFEPDATAQSRLLANLRLNGVEHSPRLTLISKFCGEEDTATHAAIDSIAKDCAEPILVKLDIEGHEMEALAGARALLQKRDVRWIIEAHTRELDERCQALFRSHGYYVQTVPRAAFRVLLPELRPAAHNAWFVAYRRS